MSPSIRTLLIVLLASVRPALAEPRTDFDDGTAQGWSLAAPPSVGFLSVVPGGNPGHCLAATDTEPAGAPLLARAPAEFTGDLSGFESIRWDEFVVDFGTDTVQATFILLRTAQGTIWANPTELEVVGAWHARTATLVESAWIHVSGSEPFSTVLENVEALFLSMDTAYLDHSALESMVDNVALESPAATAAAAPLESSSWGLVKSRFAVRN